MHTRNTSVLAFTSRKRSALSTFTRVGLAAAIACAPVTAGFAQGTPAPQNNQQNNQQRQTNGQRQPTPGRLIVPVTGTIAAATPAPAPTAGAQAAEAALTVNGSFSIQRFARTTDNGVAAVGTLTLSFTDPSSQAARTVITQVAMALARSGGSTTPANAGTASSTLASGPQTSATGTEPCQALSLVLGPLDLNLLGQNVQLDKVNLDLTVSPGAPGSMGTVLCQVASQLEGSAQPAEVVKTLNALLDTVG